MEEYNYENNNYTEEENQLIKELWDKNYDMKDENLI